MSSLSALKEAMRTSGFGIEVDFDALSVIAALKCIMYASHHSVNSIKSMEYKKFAKDTEQGVILIVNNTEYICSKKSTFVRVKENNKTVGYILKDFTYPSSTIFLNRFKENSFGEFLDSVKNNIQEIRDCGSEEFLIGDSGTLEKVIPSTNNRSYCNGILVEATVAALINQLKYKPETITVTPCIESNWNNSLLLGCVHLYPEQSILFVKTEEENFSLKEELTYVKTRVCLKKIVPLFDQLLEFIKEKCVPSNLDYYVRNHGSYDYVSIWVSERSSVSPIFSIKLERV